MRLSLLPPAAPLLLRSLASHSRVRHRSNWVSKGMGKDGLIHNVGGPVMFRLSKVSGFTTELLETHAEDPRLHVLFVPGNPGAITFYKNFVQSLYEQLEGYASITAIGHISHTSEDWDCGRLFSLQEQIDHKIDFIEDELRDVNLPIVLVGHSIGSYISLEMLRKCKDKVVYCIGLYPFISRNQKSLKQSIIAKIASSSSLSTMFSVLVASMGLLPLRASKLIVSKTLGLSWSPTAIEAACTHLLQYHTLRNALFMAMTEFKRLSDKPDWELLREQQRQIAYLYGIDDHWGPLETYEEISKQAPEISLSIEAEGHTHAFCCTEAGSTWVACHVSSLIKKQISSLRD